MSFKNEKPAVIHLLPTQKLSGAERVVFDMAKRQNALNYKVVVVCAGGTLATLMQDAGLKVKVMNLMDFSFATVKQLTEYIKAEGFEVIHAHDLRASIYAYFVSRRLKNIKTVSHIHLCYKWIEKMTMFKLVDKFIRRRLDVSVACSKYVYNFYRDHNSSIRPDKITYIPNSFDFKALEDVEKIITDDNITKRLKNDGFFIFGYIGRLSGVKNLNFTITVFHKFKSQFASEKIKLVIIGEGPEVENLKLLIHKLQMHNDVLLLGHLHDPLLHLKYFDVSLLFSSNEGLPLAMIEAMAMRKIVITTRIAGLNELIYDEKNGFFINNDLNEQEVIAKLVDVYQNYHFYEDVRNNAFNTISEQFNLSPYIEKMEIVYRNA